MSSSRASKSKTQGILDSLKNLTPNNNNSVIRYRPENDDPLGSINPVSAQGSSRSTRSRRSIRSKLSKNLEEAAPSGIAVATIISTETSSNGYLKYIKYILAIIVGLFLLYWLVSFILDYFGIYIFKNNDEKEKREVKQKIKKKREKEHKKEREEKQKEEKKELKDLIKKDLKENKERLKEKSGSVKQEKTALEKALDEFKNNNKKMNVTNGPMFDDSMSKMQAKRNPGKSGFCYIGEDKGFRSCLYVNSGHNCVSGDIFPTKEICINPNLRYQMD